MACSIDASITSTGVVASGDASGNLDLQSNGTTGLSINSGGKVVYANTALSTASAGTLEYDGKVPYFTPLGTQRGVVPGMQYYRLNSGYVGSNVSTDQSMFGVSVTLSTNTQYAFQGFYLTVKTAGATSHTVSVGFGGTATLNNISYVGVVNWSADGTSNPLGLRATPRTFYSNTASATAATAAIAAAGSLFYFTFSGTISIDSGGTFTPQYSLSAAPGGAYTTQIGSYFLIYPIGTSGSNTSVGTWA
jgi:hypothetical protein